MKLGFLTVRIIQLHLLSAAGRASIHSALSPLAVNYAEYGQLPTGQVNLIGRIK